MEHYFSKWWIEIYLWNSIFQFNSKRTDRFLLVYFSYWKASMWWWELEEDGTHWIIISQHTIRARSWNLNALPVLKTSMKIQTSCIFTESTSHSSSVRNGCGQIGLIGRNVLKEMYNRQEMREERKCETVNKRCYFFWQEVFQCFQTIDTNVKLKSVKW